MLSKQINVPLFASCCRGGWCFDLFGGGLSGFNGCHNRQLKAECSVAKRRFYLSVLMALLGISKEGKRRYSVRNVVLSIDKDLLSLCLRKQGSGTWYFRMDYRIL